MRLVITDNVQDKMNIWNKHDNGNEISGTALYKITERDENNYPKEIVLKDFIILNMGTSATTEYSGLDMAFAINEMKDNFEDDCFIGIIHSHIDMDTFFSTTDTTQLMESTPQVGFLVSTIWNHRGKISAMISYSDQYKNKVSCKITEIVTPIPVIDDKFKAEIDRVIEAWKRKQIVTKPIYGSTTPFNSKIDGKKEQAELPFYDDYYDTANYLPDEHYEPEEDDNVIAFYLEQTINEMIKEDCEAAEAFLDAYEFLIYKGLSTYNKTHICATFLLYDEGTITEEKMYKLLVNYGLDTLRGEEYGSKI